MNIENGYCPFNQGKYCVIDCPLWYKETENIQGCSIRMIAYYLNWIGNVMKGGD